MVFLEKSELDVMDSNYTGNPLEGFLHFSDPATPERIKEVARRELGETEELKQKCLHEIRKLIKDKNLHCITTDEFLLRFLRVKKFNVNASFQALQNYAHQRKKFHNLLSDLRPEVLESCLTLNTYGFLPYRDAQERMVFLVKSGAWDMDICSFQQLVMVFILFLNYAFESESSQTAGMVVIWDHGNIDFRHLPHFARNAKFAASFLFNCVPIRYGNVHFVNESPFLSIVLYIANPFFPKKIKERVFYHGKTRDVLLEHFSPLILPSEFGGTLGPLNNEHLRQVMLDYLQKMKNEQQYFL